MSNTTLGAQALLHTIQIKKAEVIALLLKHGVVVSSTTPDMEIAMIVTNLCKTSNSFYKGFTKLIADKKVVETIYSSMDGYSNTTGGTFYTPSTFDIGDTTTTTTNYCDKPENKALALCGGSTASNSNTTPKSSTSWLTNALNLAQTGFNGYLQLDTNKTKRALADASVQVTQAGGNVNGMPPATKSSNTALYVVLGFVGVSVIGLLVYLATKKKA
jgi:hypothetical protein